jgi:hypothetical protein
MVFIARFWDDVLEWIVNLKNMEKKIQLKIFKVMICT